jgi:hypothetical protein
MSHAQDNPRSIVNRHIKNQAKKDPDLRIEGHPAEDSDEFRRVWSQRNCFNRAKDEDEKDDRRAISQRGYRTKVKSANEDLLNEKISEAFRGLEYVSFEMDLC